MLWNNDYYYYLSSRLYAAIEIVFCYALFSANPSSGRISKRALVESYSFYKTDFLGLKMGTSYLAITQLAT